MSKFSDILNRKCDKCNCKLHYITREFGITGRFDLFMCPKCNYEYMVRTNISGETEFSKINYNK